MLCLAVAWGLVLAGPALGQTPPAVTQPTGEQTNVNVSERGTVEMHVQGTDVRKLLQMLSAQSKRNIIATKGVVGTVTVDLYDVTFAEALDAALSSAGFKYVVKGNFIYVMTAKEHEDLQSSERQMTVKVFRLNYITAADAKTLIAPAMSRDGSLSITPAAAVGVGPSAIDSGGNALANEDVIVVKDYAEHLEKITAILRDLDVRPQQVLIEATLMVASLNEDNALGIDFNTLAGIDFRGIGAGSTDLTDITPGAVPDAQLDKAGAAFRTDFNSAITGGGLTVGFIHNNIGLFLRAIETVTDMVVLANPKLLVMNKQRGEVMVGRRDGYITTTFTETTATQTVEFLETGTKLVVRPYIASDGYIRLEIHPEDSTGGITAESLPQEQTTEVTTNVLVKDGHTLVIGGLFREKTDNNRGQIPFLGNIPYAGNLFRRRVENTEREEVIVVVTPHIIRHPIDEAASEQVLDDMWRIRYGQRQGLMCFGRDRLAQGHMRQVRQHLAAGDSGKALWDLNMALSLQPHMEEALRVKERMTQQAIWANEARDSSASWIIQKMIMQDLGLPVDRLVPPGKPRDGMTLPEPVRGARGIGPMYEDPMPGCRTPDADAAPPEVPAETPAKPEVKED